MRVKRTGLFQRLEKCGPFVSNDWTCGASSSINPCSSHHGLEARATIPLYRPPRRKGRAKRETASYACSFAMEARRPRRAEMPRQARHEKFLSQVRLILHPPLDPLQGGENYVQGRFPLLFHAFSSADENADENDRRLRPSTRHNARRREAQGERRRVTTLRKRREGGLPANTQQGISNSQI